MPTESGLKLRTKLESASTLSFTNSSGSTTYVAGEMTIVGTTIGVIVEPVGTSSSTPGATYPHGPNGVLVYAAERIMLPKATGGGDSFSPGDTIYYDSTNQDITATSAGNTACGRALVSAVVADIEVEADLIVLS